MTARQPERHLLTEVFMQRCRSYISDQYIPGMSEGSFFDPYVLPENK